MTLMQKIWLGVGAAALTGTGLYLYSRYKNGLPIVPWSSKRIPRDLELLKKQMQKAEARDALDQKQNTSSGLTRDSVLNVNV